MARKICEQRRGNRNVDVNQSMMASLHMLEFAKMSSWNNCSSQFCGPEQVDVNAARE